MKDDNFPGQADDSTHVQSVGCGINQVIAGLEDPALFPYKCFPNNHMKVNSEKRHFP